MESLRILHIGKYYPPVPGGIETFLRDLVHSQIKSNLGIKVIVHSDETYERIDPSTDDKEVVKRVKTYGKLLYAPIAPSFRDEIIKILREFKPNIIHLHMPNTSVFWLLTIEEAKRIPWVIHWHADVLFSQINPLLSFAYNFYKPLETQMLIQAKRIISTSPPYLATSKSLLPFKDKCCIIPLGINPDRFKDIEKSDIKWAEEQWGATKKRILSVGRLAYYKGYHNLINAMKYVNNVKLIIVGEGEKKKELNNLIKNNGLQDNISLLGHVPDKRLHALFATSDVFCLPSIERTEAFGLVLLEALAFKKPFIVSDVEGSGMSWILMKTEAGYKFRYDSISSLVMAIEDIFNNDLESTKKIMENAQRGLPDEFHINNVCERITQIYKEIV